MNDKIDILKAVHGTEGFAAYIMLLQEIYPTEDGSLDMSVVFRWKTLGKKFGINEEKLREIIADMLEIGLFDKKHFDATQKLTSDGIKKRIEEVDGRRFKDRKRKTEPIPPTENSFPSENESIPEDNDGKSAQKEKEKEKESIVTTIPEKPDEIADAIDFEIAKAKINSIRKSVAESEMFRDNLCIPLRLQVDQYVILLTAFFDDQVALAQTKEVIKYDDLKQHFKNWVTKQVNLGVNSRYHPQFKPVSPFNSTPLTNGPTGQQFVARMVSAKAD